MYENPKLNRVGEAKDVVQGIVPTGDDIDGNWVTGDFEFAEEIDTDTIADA